MNGKKVMIDGASVLWLIFTCEIIFVSCENKLNKQKYELSKKTKKANSFHEETEEMVKPLKSRVETIALDSREQKVLFAGTSAGLVVYDITDIRNPSEISSLVLPGTVTGIAQYGGTLFVSTGPEGIAVVSVQEIKTPLLLGRILVPGSAMGVEYMDEGILAVSDGAIGLELIYTGNLLEAKNLVKNEYVEANIFACWRGADYVRDMAVQEDSANFYVYAAGGRDGLIAFEIKKETIKYFLQAGIFSSGETGYNKPPNDLVPFAVMKFDGEVRSVDVWGNKIYAANGNKGIVIVMREGSNLKQVGSFAGNFYDFIRKVNVLSENNVFISAGQEGIFLINFSAKKEGEIVWKFPSRSPVMQAEVFEDMVFVATDTGGITVFDISKLPAIEKLADIIAR